jgi:hypothetical protein
MGGSFGLSRATNYDSRLLIPFFLGGRARVLADFSFFIRELGALLAEFLATTVFQLGNENDVWRFIFHGWFTSENQASGTWNRLSVMRVTFSQV